MSEEGGWEVAFLGVMNESYIAGGKTPLRCGIRSLLRERHLLGGRL